VGVQVDDWGKTAQGKQGPRGIRSCSSSQAFTFEHIKEWITKVHAADHFGPACSLETALERCLPSQVAWEQQGKGRNQLANNVITRVIKLASIRCAGKAELTTGCCSGKCKSKLTRRCNVLFADEERCGDMESVHFAHSHLEKKDPKKVRGNQTAECGNCFDYRTWAFPEWMKCFVLCERCHRKYDKMDK
jgi:hypothetical protein